MRVPRPKFAALVLAAGYSSRMGQFKPRLPLGNCSAIEHAIAGFQGQPGIRDVIVVTGHRVQELDGVLKDFRVHCVFNPQHHHGMYSSIVAGLRALPRETDACFVLPADMPLVRPATIKALSDAYCKNRAPVVYPVFAARRGHPPLISKNLFAPIIAGDGTGGLRAVLSLYESQAETVSVLDEGIHLDMDTQSDYARLNTLAVSRDVLSQPECEALFANLGVSEGVVRHSHAVAEVAEKLAAALVQHGEHLNLALIRAGSLLHDVAKGTPDHAHAGAHIIERLGYPKIAEIVACHADLQFQNGALDEAAIVYLADKLVQGETVVTLRQRFQRSFEKFRDDPVVLPIVKRRWETAQSVARAVEQRCAMHIAEILAKERAAGESVNSAADRNPRAPEPEDVVLGSTESLCPECLERIEAKRVRERGHVYLTKTCPNHGQFKTVLWRGEPSYESWAITGKRPSQPPVCASDINRGCPFECGLCSDHRQHTCCVLLEVTQRCNLACPFCFAASPHSERDPGMDEIEGWLRMLLAAGGPFNLQLSGGEPTLRDDLPEIIALARSLGFTFIQLNTNGLRLAEEEQYLHSLKGAGLDCVFLQFDGVTDAVYKRIRGKALLEAKQRLVRHCREEALGVVLVPTLVPGVNTSQIGEIIRFAIQSMPTVRAVHFQPVSYVGRYPGTPSDRDRITLPEVMRYIEWHTQGKIKASDFYPPSAENAYCSFQGKFVLQPDGELKPSSRPKQSACCTPVGLSPENLVQLGNTRSAADGSKRAREFVARQWASPAREPVLPSETSSLMNVESLDSFLRDEQRKMLSISGMAFQDAWNLDLERLRECFIHVISPDRRLVPLCAYNLTDLQGHALYRINHCKRAAVESAHA